MPDLSPVRPNFVVILADDLGFGDLGSFGGESCGPALDQLAYGGLRMTQMYNCARCCPSRASLLTGLYPHQAGVGDMTQPLEHPSYQGYLRYDGLTIAEVLRDSGYRTYMSGKWHVGRDYVWGRPGTWVMAGAATQPRPVDRGFDHHFGTLTGAGSYYAPDTLIRDDTFLDFSELAEDFYYTDAITDHAVGCIRDAAASGQPFFLYVAHVAPHWPLHALERDVARFRGQYLAGWDVVRAERFRRQVAMGILPDDTRLAPRTRLAVPWRDVPDPKWEDARMAAYAAQIYRMDVGVRRIVAELEHLNLSSNTLVLFISDNGGSAERLEARGELPGPLALTRSGEHVTAGNVVGLLPGPASTFMSYDAGWANVSNAPFRLFKTWVHEGGIATPFVAYWPGVIKGGSIIHEPAHFVDITATIADLAGATWPRERDGRQVQRPSGESFAAALRGQGWERQEPIYWEHEGNRAVRAGAWKLVAQYGRTWELYNMDRDRSEQTDMAGDRPEVVRELDGLYTTWARRAGVVDWGTVRQWMRTLRPSMNWSWVVHGEE